MKDDVKQGPSPATEVPAERPHLDLSLISGGRLVVVPVLQPDPRPGNRSVHPLHPSSESTLVPVFLDQ